MQCVRLEGISRYGGRDVGNCGWVIAEITVRTAMDLELCLDEGSTCEDGTTISLHCCDCLKLVSLLNYFC